MEEQRQVEMLEQDEQRKESMTMRQSSKQVHPTSDNNQRALTNEHIDKQLLGFLQQKAEHLEH